MHAIIVGVDKPMTKYDFYSQLVEIRFADQALFEDRWSASSICLGRIGQGDRTKRKKEADMAQGIGQIEMGLGSAATSAS